MPRYVAFLRGVMPTNLKMPDLKRALEAAGFTNVKTLLSSGNVAFDARKTSEATLQTKIETALTATVGRPFVTFVRSQEALQTLLAADAFKAFTIKPTEKKVVTFLREPPTVKIKLPLEQDGGRLLAVHGSEAYTVYVPGHPKGPGFMGVLERTFTKDQTTRTWDTVRKCAVA